MFAKRVLGFLTAAAVFLVGTIFIFPQKADAVTTSASAAILMCADNGMILYEHHSHEKRAIASITKIMTAVIALEQDEDKEVKFTLDMAAEGTSMYLKENEVLKLSELTKGMMMVSGNDAANAIAVSIAGSREKFAELMNQKAEQLGMTDTHFVTPSGLDDEQHYSTAYDMAVLCRYAMRNPNFQNIVSQSSINVSYVYPKGKMQTCKNHNRLVSMYEGCIGIKTGYTSKAGRTLTSCAERNDVRLIAVTLNDRDDWNDHMALYDYGWKCVEKKTVIPADKRFYVPVVGSESTVVRVVPEHSCFAVLFKDSDESIDEKIYLPRFLYAPIHTGQAVGEINCYKQGVLIAHTRLIAAENVNYGVP